MSYEPGNYVKGDDVKVADTPARAVALVFDGYKKADEQAAAPEEVDYADLREQAKKLGIRANQSAEALAAAIAEASQPAPADGDSE